jgi:glycosyltransferase involved in cell wall biosynthesis
MIRVGVNLLWLAPGRVGGSEQYLTRQLAGLVDGDDVAPELFVQPAFAAAHPELAARFTTTPMPIDRDWRGLRIAAEHTWLRARVRHADVVHHGGGTVPFGGRVPALLTVHDLQYRQFPQYFSRARREYLAFMMPRSVRRATMIATPSDYVRGTVIEAFGVDPDRVTTVPHGVPPIAVPSPEQQAAVAARYGLQGRPYVIYPAITHPHKGHLVLVDALRNLSSGSDRGLVLVLIGGRGAAEDDVQRAIAAAGVADCVVRPGRVSDADRDALVAGARALVFPSSYEGFGAPVIEAMLLGTPVICSDHPALREVAGDAATVVPEATGAAWAHAIAETERKRDALVAAGHTRVEQFTVARSGRALATAYRRVVEWGMGAGGRMGGA